MLPDVRVQVKNKCLSTYRTLGRVYVQFPLDFVDSLFLTIHNRDFFETETNRESFAICLFRLVWSRCILYTLY